MPTCLRIQDLYTYVLLFLTSGRSFTLNKNIQTNPYLPERLRKRVHLNLLLIHNTFYFALDVGGTKIWM